MNIYIIVADWYFEIQMNIYKIALRKNRTISRLKCRGRKVIKELRLLTHSNNKEKDHEADQPQICHCPRLKGQLYNTLITDREEENLHAMMSNAQKRSEASAQLSTVVSHRV